MKRDILLSILLFSAATPCFADPISVLVPNSHTKAGGIRTIQINGSTVKYADAYEKLSELLLSAPATHNTPVVVLMDENCSFVDWDSIRGLIAAKLGFLNVRYFVFSEKSQMMVEIDVPHQATKFSLNPLPRGHEDER
jgi:hypothetical protein